MTERLELSLYLLVLSNVSAELLWKLFMTWENYSYVILLTESLANFFFLVFSYFFKHQCLPGNFFFFTLYIHWLIIHMVAIYPNLERIF